MSDTNKNNKVSGDALDLLQNDQISLLDLLLVIVDNLRLLLLGPIACGLAVLGISFTIAPTYTAKTQFLPPQQQQSSAASLLNSLGALGSLAGTATGIKNPSDQYIAFLKSILLQDKLIERFNLTERYESKLKTDVRNALTRSVRISSGKDGFISLEVDDRDPSFAADLANAHVEELRKLLGRLALTEAQQRRIFFEKQLEITKDNFTKADLALKSTGVNSTVLKSSPVSAVEAVAKLKAGISVQEVKLGSMRNYLTENSPEFKLAMSELGSLKSQLVKAEKDEPASTVAFSGGDYVSRYRDYKYQEAMFDLFMKQFELAKVDEGREGALIQVIDAAEPTERKSKPKIASNATIASFGSGFVLLLFVFVRAAFRSSFKDENTNAQLLNLKLALRKSIGK
jgi:tyrosine-protein kinase Etk/Wzc